MQYVALKIINIIVEEIKKPNHVGPAGRRTKS
jgi:hypothetical protein